VDLFGVDLVWIGFGLGCGLVWIGFGIGVDWV